MGTTQTVVDLDNNVWDIGFENKISSFFREINLLEVLGANTSSVEDMGGMFSGCIAVEGGALALYQ